MNLLILSFRAGEGHNSAAKAILEQAQASGHTAEIVDFLGLFSDKVSTVVNDSYVSVVKHVPAVFGAAYKTSLSISKHQVSHSAIYLTSTIVAEKVLKLLKQKHYDAVVCTHLMPAQAMSYLKEKGEDVPFSVAVTTDFTFYPFWEEAVHCDRHIVAHEDMITEYISKGIPKEQICPFGIPIGLKCKDLPDRTTAREMLGLPPKTTVFLVMGGSMGAGHIRTFTKKLYHKLNGAHMVIICGNNKTLHKNLELQFKGKRNVHVVGYTDQVPLYMRACDVLYTKPGGLTSSEAIACEIPLIHSAPIPGCESDNFKFFADHGCSLQAKTVTDQVRLGITLMNHPEEMEEIRKHQRAVAKPNAARDIIQTVEENLKTEA